MLRRDRNAMAIDLTSGKPLPVIFRFTLPVIGGNLFQLMYTLADTVIVGRTIGENALAAVGATGIFVYFILCFIQGMTSGFSIILAQSIGRRDREGARRNIAAAVYLSLIFTIAVTLVTCLLTPGIIRMMEVPEEIAEDAASYLFIVLAGTGATVLYNLVSNILRALGDSRMPLVFLVISSILNIVLDIIFIVPLGMGTGGAALATVLSQLLSGVLSAAAGIRRYDTLRLQKEDWKSGRKYIILNLRTGFTMGLQMSVMCIGQIVMQASVNVLGTEAIAGYTAATKVNQLAALVNNAFVTSVAAYTAQNYGAGMIARIKKGVRAAVIIAEAADLLIIAIIIAVRTSVVPLFVTGASPAVFHYAALFFLINVPFYPLLGLLCVFRTAVQSMGNSWAPFTACMTELAARCAASLLLGALFGYAGIMFSSPLAWIGADAVVIPVYFMMMHRNAKRMPQAAS